MPPEPSPDDPVERALRIGQLRAELAELTGKPVAEHTAEDAAADDPEAAFRNIDRLESDPGFPLADLLKEERNFTPLPLSRLQDRIRLREHLWLLIYALASMRVFIHDTDHLSDEELYRMLVERVLRSDIVPMPVEAGWNCRFSLCELSDSASDYPDCYLRYYADDSERDYWAREFPEVPMPPSQEPPHQRDEFLPGFG